MSNLKILKNPCPPGCIPRSQIGLKLRETHYILGKDDSESTTEYRYEYNPKKAEKFNRQLNQNRVNFLRNSHFLLGNDPLNYKTSSQEQSEAIPTKIYLNTDGNINENTQNLQKSHFTLGNDNNDFKTKYNIDYYKKVPLLSKKNKNKSEYEMIADKLKETHITPISQEINYDTEFSSKYRIPDPIGLKKNKTSLTLDPSALQESHIKFGKNETPWISTYKYFLTPKKADKNKRYISNDKLQESHISLSKDKIRDYKTEMMAEYVEFPLNLRRANNFNNELKNNLRKEHFTFGNEDNANKISSNRIDFQDPRTNKSYLPKLIKQIDPQRFRRSNWTISNGDERNFFKSTYDQMMTPKKPEIFKRNEVNTYKSSIKIGGNANPNDFLSEYQKKFIKKFNLNDNRKDKKLMETIANIRRSHFNFGDNKNDYMTTHDESYKYNPKLAEAGRGKLNSELRNNLMSSHYQIGAGNDMEKMTSNRRDYRGYPGYIHNKSVQPDNSSHIFKGTQNIFEGETIYMSDFTEKPLPDPDENVPNFL